MDVPQSINSVCNEAILTHSRLQIEEYEIEGLQSDNIGSESNANVSLRISRRETILNLGIRFLETTIEACESCHLQSEYEQVDCPNIDTLGFIKDTLTK